MVDQHDHRLSRERVPTAVVVVVALRAAVASRPRAGPSAGTGSRRAPPRSAGRRRCRAGRGRGPWRRCRSSRFERVRELAVGPLAEGREANVRRPWCRRRASSSPRAAGTATEARSRWTSRGLPPPAEPTRSSTRRARPALDPGRGDVRGLPAIDCPSTADDHVAGLGSRASWAGVWGITVRDPEAALDLRHGQADARELPRGRLLELAKLLGIEVVRELVVVALPERRGPCRRPRRCRAAGFRRAGSSSSGSRRSPARSRRAADPTGRPPLTMALAASATAAPARKPSDQAPPFDSCCSSASSRRLAARLKCGGSGAA